MADEKKELLKTVRKKKETNFKLLNTRKRNKIHETDFVAIGFRIIFTVATVSKTVCGRNRHINKTSKLNSINVYCNLY